MSKPDYKALYERQLARANTLAAHLHHLARAVDHANDVANELHGSMNRDSMGICLPPYMKLAIIATKQAANEAYMTSIRATNPENNQ